jgi:hypothetical protein
MKRHHWGSALLMAAVALAFAGFLLWGKASEDAERDSVVAAYTNAIAADAGTLGRVDTEVEPNRTPATLAWVAAAVAALGAVVVFVRPTPSPGS